MSGTEDVENLYDEIEIDDMDFEDDRFYYPCPCGDKFQITLVCLFHFLNTFLRNKSKKERQSLSVPVAPSRSESF